jgi:hypothetical protein
MEKNSIIILRNFKLGTSVLFSPTLFWAYDTILSDIQIKAAPLINPAGATNQAGADKNSSARSIAGCNKDQKLAAIITPAANPNIVFKILLLVFLKKTTVAAPKAVTIQVPIVAKRANSSTFVYKHIPPNDLLY